MKARSPLDGLFYYFVDKCLPFGASISCALFQRVSNAIAHIVSHRTGKELVNYLDDYLFAHLIKLLCNGQVSEFLDICATIKFPVALEKMFWASTRLVFLGMLIDTVTQTVSVPHEKILKGKTMLESAMKKGKLTLKQLQKICGFLNFLCRCVVPGRAFNRRLYAYTTGQKLLKPHHQFRINREMKGDMAMWLIFMDHPSVFSRPSWTSKNYGTHKS